MPIGKNTAALQVYIKKETKEAIKKAAKGKSASKVAGKILDEAMKPTIISKSPSTNEG